MNAVQALIFGFIQGFGEMLPISSSAHLVLFPYIFKIDDPGLAFDVALHFGTLIAILGFFWQDWLKIFKGLARLVREGKITNFHQKLGIFLLIASIPGAVFGLLLDNYAETIFRSPILIAGTLALMGGVLYYADHKWRGAKTIKDMTYKKSLTIGLSQALAIIPGVSRSGITISTGLFEGLTRWDAARFSFLMSAPIIAGAALAKLPDLSGQIFSTSTFWIAIVSSIVSSLLAIKILLGFVRNHSFDIFVYYRWGLAVVIVFVVLARS
ncbi:MAG: undecaprenyl-diphosphate phosphatase [bacterium]